MNEELKPFLAGFDLAGRRLHNGKLESYYSGDGCVIDDWPHEVRLFGNAYTLEKVIKGNEGYEAGVYV